jgi:hypothetical protein
MSRLRLRAVRQVDQTQFAEAGQETAMSTRRFRELVNPGTERLLLKYFLLPMKK